MAAPFFLAALDLNEKEVLVVGSGEEALSRAETLYAHGAKLTLVAPALSLGQREFLGTHPSIVAYEREPEPSDLDGKWLIVQTEQNAEWSRSLGERAKELKTFFCAIDQPSENTFAHVGVARAGSLELGISTSGKVPGLAGALRRLFQKLLDESEFEKVVAELEAARQSTAKAERGPLLRALASQIRLEGRLWLERKVAPAPQSKAPPKG